MLYNTPEILETEPTATADLWSDVAALKAQGLVSHPRSPSYEPIKRESPEPSKFSLVEDDSGTESSPETTYVTSSCQELVGLDADSLIPSSAQIDRVFAQGRETWAHLIGNAQSTSGALLPPATVDPSIMLKNVPALPPSLPRAEFIKGHCEWLVSSEEDESGLESRSGPMKHFTVSYEDSIRCRFLARTLASSDKPLMKSSEWHPIITLCWSYILSTQLLELQSRRLWYSTRYLEPQAMSTGPGSAVLYLEAATSPRLVRWLCALLAPEPGFELNDKGGFPPWMAFCTGDTQFVIRTESSFSFEPNEDPPSSSEATELLVELCHLFGTPPTDEVLLPCVAGFLAALALPFYRMEELEPHFYISSLHSQYSRESGEVQAEKINSIVADIRYYMTISMHPTSVASTIWSIFWQPEIECNVVSPWLASILYVLKPLLEAKNMDIVGRAFMLRRPRVALWWLGIFLLGSTSIIDQIARYLATLEEQYGFGTLATPDTTAAAWTGSAQSFLDQETVYITNNENIPTATVLHLRHSFRLQCCAGPLLSWRPFGDIPRHNIEPDLMPWLVSMHVRKYRHWVWVESGHGGDSTGNFIQRGFWKDTGRFIEKVNENAGLLIGHDGPRGRISLAPSKRATLRMLNYSMMEISGDRHRDNAGIHGLDNHPWLKGWRG